MKVLIQTLAVAVALVVNLTAANGAQEKLRVIIETDAGGDPDDEQSLVRFLLYANHWDVEGIIANRPIARAGENLNPVRTGLGIVRQHLSAYRAVYDRLREHASDFPTPDRLWERTVSGYADSDHGVNLIISAADREDPRPVWFQNWGTDHGSDPSNLKRALDKVFRDRGPEGYAKFKSKILLSSDDQFGDHTQKLSPAWRFWIEPSMPKLEGAFMYHRFGPLTATAGGFDIQRDVLVDHGPLGALYPTNTNIRQKEGDTPYFLYLIPTGMNDPMQPQWGSWAGRFGPRDEQQPPVAGWFWANVRDQWEGTTNRDNTLKRWATDLQNDFKARLDWCVKRYAEANHPPVAVLNGDSKKRILTMDCESGSLITLDARGTDDPDKDDLSYEWITYPEAGTCKSDVPITDADKQVAKVIIPKEASGSDIHIILIVHDNGSPPLAAYRRAILHVKSSL